MKITLLFCKFRTNSASNQDLKRMVCMALLLLFGMHTTLAQYQLASPEPVEVSNEACIFWPDPDPIRGFVPVPENIKQAMERGPGCATITVNYTGFTAPAQTAFEYAVAIWETVITSSITIEIDALFSGGLPPGALGGASANAYYVLTGPGIPADTAFPVALANALTVSDIEPGIADIDATFSSTASFYFGTDGNPPPGQFDFVSVVLHEIGHGLGVAGFGRVDDDMTPTQGEIRFGAIKSIWDNFIENGTGTDILSFADPSAALLTEFTSDDLFSNGTNAVNANGGMNPQTHAPGTWAGGSSYSHWDESYFPAGNINSLMTPLIGDGEANHDPGPVTVRFMEDMFWTICDDYLSTSNVSATKPLNYFPNPVNGELNLYARGLIQNIEIFNMLGQKILQVSPNGNAKVLDLSELSDGAYFVQVTIDNTTEIIKVLKN